ncbi:MAG: ClpXP protease specificity-enhancing factor [Pseudomonadales bacterium]|nr:ClpXP protease specificity-enhancing factor [Pseudomonadales bacterium]NIX06913.1 ClpXP protease specificity-enhancing factor [Pseudomonadales bacterium]
MNAKAKRPYLLRALYDWLVDSSLTPYVLVSVEDESVIVPADYVDDGKIVLNVSPTAVRGLQIGDETLSFDGRFGGVPHAVSAPVASVLAIYAKETGEGMMFDPEEFPSRPDDPADGPKDRPTGPELKVIK